MTTVNSRRFISVIYAFMAFGIIAQTATLAYAVRQSGGQQERIDSVNRFIYCTLDRSEKTLPTIDYYRVHPDELARQLSLVREQKEQFDPPPEPCNP